MSAFDFKIERGDTEDQEWDYNIIVENPDHIWPLSLNQIPAEIKGLIGRALMGDAGVTIWTGGLSPGYLTVDFWPDQIRANLVLWGGSSPAEMIPEDFPEEIRGLAAEEIEGWFDDHAEGWAGTKENAMFVDEVAYYEGAPDLNEFHAFMLAFVLSALQKAVKLEEEFNAWIPTLKEELLEEVGA